MMKRLYHPNNFKSGIRVLSLVSRNKDSSEKHRTVSRVSYSSEDFDIQLQYLLDEFKSGQRIYAFVQKRSMDKAIREFKRRQLNADYEDTHTFYKDLRRTWESCLMKPNVAEDKLWLLDCDSDEEIEICEKIIHHREALSYTYSYSTKNGKHYIIEPFDISAIVNDDEYYIFKDCLTKNALMLWAYDE